MGKKIKSADSSREQEEMGEDEKKQRKVMEGVAKYLRSKVPTKSAVIKGEKVEYFTASKAVDLLMESKWTNEPKSNDPDQPYFINRTYAVDYCRKLLHEQFFVRAEKLHKDDPNDLPVGGVAKEGKGGSTSARKRGEKVSDSPRPKKQGEGGGEKRTRRKFRLDYHRQQIFLDSKDEVYYWKYDPPSYGSYFIGFAVVVGAIALTLQPLWPDSSREMVWYVSMAVLVLMSFMILLIVVRLVLNGVILVVTAGKLKFWILPNLDNEKAGFFESFKPFYSAEWVKEKKKSKKSSLTDKTDTSINITENPENELNSEIQSKLKENEVNEETSLAKETCS